MQWMKHLGLGRISVPVDSTEVHNALVDARWNKKAYNFLKQKESEIFRCS